MKSCGTHKQFTVAVPGAKILSAPKDNDDAVRFCNLRCLCSKCVSSCFVCSIFSFNWNKTKRHQCTDQQNKCQHVLTRSRRRRIAWFEHTHLWQLNVVVSLFSFKSCQFLRNLTRHLFPVKFKVTSAKTCDRAQKRRLLYCLPPVLKLVRSIAFGVVLCFQDCFIFVQFRFRQLILLNTLYGRTEHLFMRPHTWGTYQTECTFCLHNSSSYTHARTRAEKLGFYFGLSENQPVAEGSILLQFCWQSPKSRPPLWTRKQLAALKFHEAFHASFKSFRQTQSPFLFWIDFCLFLQRCCLFSLSKQTWHNFFFS